MIFTESKIVKAHLRGLLAGPVSACPVQVSSAYVPAGGRISSLACCIGQCELSSVASSVEDVY